MAEPAAGVKTPFGMVSHKTAAIGAAVIAVIIIIVYERQKSATAATAAAAAATPPAAATTTGISSSSDPYPADGTVGNPSDLNSTDPATNQTYGDEQSGVYGYGGALTGGGGSTYAGTVTGRYTSNSQWSQAAQNDLVNANHPAETAAAALGAYITGSPASSAQQSLIEQAIAFEGYPPVSGPTGFPPSIRLVAAPPGGTPPGGTPPADVTIPAVTGKTGAEATALLHAAGLRDQVNKPHGFRGAYTIEAQNPAAGHHVPRDTVVKLSIRKA